MQPLVIPSHLHTDEGRVDVRRAWFERLDHGHRRLSFEGRDEAGALRAGRAWFDPGARPARVELAPHGRDERLPALARLLRLGGELLVHRAGRRAVVRTTDGFAKALRPAKLAAAERRARGFAALSGRMRTPQVLRTADDGELTVSVVPGPSLHEMGTLGGPTAWQAGWDAWARAWPDWVCTPGLGDELPRYTVEDEGRTLSEWLLRVELARPQGVGLGSLRERFGAVMEELSALPEDRWWLSHRDLHDKQILSTGLIDSDTLALADPGLDLGNLLAHVRLREAQGLLTPARAAAAEQVIRTVAGRIEVPDRTLNAWCEAASLRLTCVYAFRPAGSSS